MWRSSPKEFAIAAHGRLCAAIFGMDSILSEPLRWLDSLVLLLSFSSAVHAIPLVRAATLPKCNLELLRRQRRVHNFMVYVPGAADGSCARLCKGRPGGGLGVCCVSEGVAHASLFIYGRSPTRSETASAYILITRLEDHR